MRFSMWQSKKKVISLCVNSAEIVVAGVTITNGIMNRKTSYRLRRGDNIIADNLKLFSLKILKKDVSSVQKGNDCGISFEEYTDIKPADIIECYETHDDIKEKNERNKISLTTAL